MDEQPTASSGGGGGSGAVAAQARRAGGLSNLVTLITRHVRSALTAQPAELSSSGFGLSELSCLPADRASAARDVGRGAQSRGGSPDTGRAAVRAAS